MIRKILLLLFLSSTAFAAQTGPYYITFPAYCDVYELYYNGNAITGTVSGCVQDETPVEITGRVIAYKTHTANKGRFQRWPTTVKYKELNFTGDGIKYKDVLDAEGISELYFGADDTYLLGSKYIESNTKPTELLEQ